MNSFLISVNLDYISAQPLNAKTITININGFFIQTLYFFNIDPLLMLLKRVVNTEEDGGRYKTRTCNFHRVKVALYQLS